MSLFDDDARRFLLGLLDTPAPSGFERAAAEAFTRYAETFAEARVDAVGNAYATVNAGKRPRVALWGHIDEIGLIVTKVDDKGYVRVTNIGGWDIGVLIGQRVRILGEHDVVYGSIVRGAVHTLGDQRDKLPKLKDLWVDIAVNDAAEARASVSVGDPVVIDAQPRESAGGVRLVSRSLDNRIGAFIALQVARECAGARVEVTAVGSIHEETGGAGAATSAFAHAPDYAVAIDVTPSSDTPAGHELHVLELGKGPVITRGASTNAELVEQLIGIARSNDIPFQLRGLGHRTGTDADSIVRSGAGMRTALISIPARYLHSPVEQVDLRDVRAAVDLLATWAPSLAS